MDRNGTKWTNTYDAAGRTDSHVTYEADGSILSWTNYDDLYRVDNLTVYDTQGRVDNYYIYDDSNHLRVFDDYNPITGTYTETLFSSLGEGDTVDDGYQGYVSYYDDDFWI